MWLLLLCLCVHVYSDIVWCPCLFLCDDSCSCVWRSGEACGAVAVCVFPSTTVVEPLPALDYAPLFTPNCPPYVRSPPSASQPFVSLDYYVFLCGATESTTPRGTPFVFLSPPVLCVMCCVDGFSPQSLFYAFESGHLTRNSFVFPTPSLPFTSPHLSGRCSCRDEKRTNVNGPR